MGIQRATLRYVASESRTRSSSIALSRQVNLIHRKPSRVFLKGQACIARPPGCGLNTNATKPRAEHKLNALLPDLSRLIHLARCEDYQTSSCVHRSLPRSLVWPRNHAGGGGPPAHECATAKHYHLILSNVEKGDHVATRLDAHTSYSV